MNKLVIKTKLAVLAAFCFLAFGLWTTLLVERSSWHRSDGKITALDVQCAMRATKDDHVYTKDISCDLVDVFKLMHGDKTWTVKEKYNATVAFAGIDGAPATTQMKLYASNGKPPAVGDTFPVLQNPKDLAEVIRPEGMGSVFMTLAAGVIGCAIVYFVFGRRLLKRKTTSPAREEPGQDTDRMKKADAMIASALAKRETEARASAPAPLIVRAGTRQAQGFGRKR